MRKLLVPIDGSDSANRALEHAIGLAGDGGGAELVLLHVHPEPIIYGEIQVYVPPHRMQQLQDQHSHEILRPAAERTRASSVPHTSVVVAGEAATEIAKAAEALGCAAIVMGTRGMSPIGSLLLGSVASKVVHLAHVPVTLVK
jgi:nucleotide-binding universal stress UspA family protein